MVALALQFWLAVAAGHALQHSWMQSCKGAHSQVFGSQRSLKQ